MLRIGLFGYVLVGFVLAAVFAFVAYGQTRQRPVFEATDLPGLIRNPPRTPTGVRYAAAESGRVRLTEVVTGVGSQGEARERRLRAIGFRSAYQSTFRAATANGAAQPIIGATAVAILFADERSATRAVAILAESQRAVANVAAGEVVAVPASTLGVGSWGYTVTLVSGTLVTFGWRERNVVLLAAMGGADTAFSEKDARAYARALDLHARV